MRGGLAGRRTSTVSVRWERDELVICQWWNIGKRWLGSDGIWRQPSSREVDGDVN